MILVYLLFLSIFQVAQSSCPNGFDLVRNGECRGLYKTESIQWQNASSMAIKRCKEINAQPVIIHSAEDNLYWKTKEADWLLIGIVCNSSSKKWKWADGSAVDYKPQTYNTSLNNACTPTGCTWTLHNIGGLEWTMSCNDPVYYDTDIFCTTQIHSHIEDYPCEAFDDDIDDGVCYQIGTVAESWQDAQMICKKLGANLASIHNLQENSFLRRLAVSKGAVTGLYLGASISGKGGDFGWIDGSEWDFQNFAPGFPKPGFGECVAMDTSTSSGQWVNIACTQKLPVACIRNQIITSDLTCSSETWKEGSVITSPGFPYSASTPCDYYLMVDENKRVELEMIHLEANSCCDNLTIYDGYLGSVLANISGEVSNMTFTTSSEYIMKVSWKPNGGVGVMGLAMTFRGV